MLIDKFGGTVYASAFQITHSGEVDDWTITRPTVTDHIGGVSGAFDSYGTLNYPYGPMIVSKRFMVASSTWAGVEEELDNLIGNTIYADEGILWGVKRDGTAHVWTYAKCTKLDLGDKVDGNSPNIPGAGQYVQEVSIEFFCHTGEWYAEGASATSYQPAFSVKLLDHNNNVVSGGTINSVLSVSYEERLNESGAISFTVAATDTTVANLLDDAFRFRIDFSGGSVSRYGIIDNDTLDATADPPIRTVNGADMLRDLQHYSMGWWCFFDDKDIVNDVLPAIVSGTDWTVSTIDASGANIYYRFDGDSKLAALIKIAEATGKYFRLTNTYKQLEWGDLLGAAPATTFYSVAGAYVAYDGIQIIGSLQITSDRAPIVNRIYPWGAGQDNGDVNRAKVSLFHLDPADARWANIGVTPGVRGAETRITSIGQNEDGDPHIYNVIDSTGFTPVPITQLFWCMDPADLTLAKGYDFVIASIASGTRILVRGSPTLPAVPASFPAYLISNPQLYLEDGVSYAADPREAVVIFSDITLTDLSLDSFELAASQLYDRAAQYLAMHKVAQLSYAVTVYNCPDTLRVGNMVHISYTGAVIERNGVQIDWATVDDDFYVINITRKYNADGSKSAVIEVSNVGKQPVDSSATIAGMTGNVGYHATTVGSLLGGSLGIASGLDVEGIPGRVAEFASANSMQAATLIKSGAGVLTLSAAADYTATVPRAGTIAMMGTAARNADTFQAQDGDFYNLILPETSSTQGQISIGGLRFAHLYNAGLFVGSGAGNFTLTGSGNTGIGEEALKALTDGGYNVVLGKSVMDMLTTGDRNVAIGTEALKRVVSGDGNVAIGYKAGYYNTGSNKLYIENSDTTYPLIYGEFDNDLIKLTAITAETNTAHVLLTLQHNSTGTPAAGFGVRQLFLIGTSAYGQDAAAIDAVWNVATHASRVADLVLSAAYSGGWSEFLRGRGGSASAIGLYGATPVTRATTAGSASTFTANSGTAVNDASTFDGYTLGQITKALRDIGILT